MLIEKDVWNLVLTGPQPERQNPTLFSKETKKDPMAVGIARQIIPKGVNNQIAFNIMDLEDPKEMWEKLTSICIEIGQDVVYLILQELFNYLKINKSKGYDKPVMQIFAKVRYLYKCLRIAMTPGHDLWDTIAIVIAINTLHDDFNTITASLLENRDKTINRIQSILQSKEAKNISKQTTGVVGNLAMSYKQNNNWSLKKKAHPDKEYFNCHELGHYGQDCPYVNRQNPRMYHYRDSNKGRNRRGRGQGLSKNNSRQHQNRAHQAASNNNNNEKFDPKPFIPGPVAAAFMVAERPLQL